MPTFPREGHVVLFAYQEATDNADIEDVVSTGDGPGNFIALADALFQATQTLEPDNWVKCPDNGPFFDSMDDPMIHCLVCYDTDQVLKKSCNE